MGMDAFLQQDILHNASPLNKPTILLLLPFEPDLCCALHSFATKPDNELFLFVSKDARLLDYI